jgi:hypothetical protein
VPAARQVREARQHYDQILTRPFGGEPYMLGRARAEFGVGQPTRSQPSMSPRWPGDVRKVQAEWIGMAEKALRGLLGVLSLPPLDRSPPQMDGMAIAKSSRERLPKVPGNIWKMF